MVYIGSSRVYPNNTEGMIGPTGPSGPMGPVGSFDGSTSGLTGPTGPTGYYIVEGYTASDSFHIKLSNDIGFTLDNLLDLENNLYDAYGITMPVPVGFTGGNIFDEYLQGASGTTFFFKSITGGANITVTSTDNSIIIKSSSNSFSGVTLGAITDEKVIITSSSNSDALQDQVISSSISIIPESGITGALDLEYNNVFNPYSLNKLSVGPIQETELVGITGGPCLGGPCVQGEGILLDIRDGSVIKIATPIGIQGITGEFNSLGWFSFTAFIDGNDLWDVPSDIKFENDTSLGCGLNIVHFTYDPTLSSSNWKASLVSKNYNKDDCPIIENSIGSCCYINESGSQECLEYMTSEDCTINYGGNFSLLTPCSSSCSELIIGICCIGPDCHQDMSNTECDYFGGIFWDYIPCPPNSSYGVCCLSGNRCETNTLIGYCDSSGGTWYSYDVGADCGWCLDKPEDTGACCPANSGDCYQTTGDKCISPWNFLGVGTECSQCGNILGSACSTEVTSCIDNITNDESPGYPYIWSPVPCSQNNTCSSGACCTPDNGGDFFTCRSNILGYNCTGTFYPNTSCSGLSDEQCPAAPEDHDFWCCTLYAVCSGYDCCSDCTLGKCLDPNDDCSACCYAAAKGWFLDGNPPGNYVCTGPYNTQDYDPSVQCPSWVIDQELIYPPCNATCTAGSGCDDVCTGSVYVDDEYVYACPSCGGCAGSECPGCCTGVSEAARTAEDVTNCADCDVVGEDFCCDPCQQTGSCCVNVATDDLQDEYICIIPTLDDGTPFGCISELQCEILDGTWVEGGVCGEIDCCEHMPLLGACCVFDNSLNQYICTIATPTNCLNSGGLFMGHETSCDDMLCGCEAYGACCIPNFDNSTYTCEETTGTNCTQLEGIFVENSLCGNTDCNEISFTGACCNEYYGTCADNVSITDCTGTFHFQDTCDSIVKNNSLLLDPRLDPTDSQENSFNTSYLQWKAWPGKSQYPFGAECEDLSCSYCGDSSGDSHCINCTIDDSVFKYHNNDPGYVGYHCPSCAEYGRCCVSKWWSVKEDLENNSSINSAEEALDYVDNDPQHEGLDGTETYCLSSTEGMCDMMMGHFEPSFQQYENSSCPDAPGGECCPSSDPTYNSFCDLDQVVCCSRTSGHGGLEMRDSWYDCVFGDFDTTGKFGVPLSPRYKTVQDVPDEIKSKLSCGQAYAGGVCCYKHHVGSDCDGNWVAPWLENVCSEIAEEDCHFNGSTRYYKWLDGADCSDNPCHRGIHCCTDGECYEFTVRDGQRDCGAGIEEYATTFPTAATVCGRAGGSSDILGSLGMCCADNAGTEECDGLTPSSCTGACCVNGNCEDLLLSECDGGSTGNYLGPGTECKYITCGGRCCPSYDDTAGTQCQHAVDLAACRDLNGYNANFDGHNTVCGDATCENNGGLGVDTQCFTTGACCIQGSCTDMEIPNEDGYDDAIGPEECHAQNGTWHYRGSCCSRPDFDCNTKWERGACCWTDQYGRNRCWNASRQFCDQAFGGGEWQGINTTCNDENLPGMCYPEGACCLPDGTCQYTSKQSCLSWGETSYFYEPRSGEQYYTDCDDDVVRCERGTCCIPNPDELHDAECKNTIWPRCKEYLKNSCNTYTDYWEDNFGDYEGETTLCFLDNFYDAMDEYLWTLDNACGSNGYNCNFPRVACCDDGVCIDNRYDYAGCEAAGGIVLDPGDPDWSSCDDLNCGHVVADVCVAPELHSVQTNPSWRYPTLVSGIPACTCGAGGDVGACWKTKGSGNNCVNITCATCVDDYRGIFLGEGSDCNQDDSLGDFLPGAEGTCWMEPSIEDLTYTECQQFAGFFTAKSACFDDDGDCSNSTSIIPFKQCCVEGNVDVCVDEGKTDEYPRYWRAPTPDHPWFYSCDGDYP